jgi:muramoyltetrapeptide carboxypeptidase LdcA involved in peptidoglycan recycling
MEKQEEAFQAKGLWQQMQEAETVVYNSKPITLSELQEFFQKSREKDQKRRELLDKEYTPIEKITLQEINEEIAKWEKNGEEVPSGLMCKIKIAGSYQMWPIKGVQLYLESVEKLAKKWKNEKNNK